MNGHLLRSLLCLTGSLLFSCECDVNPLEKIVPKGLISGTFCDPKLGEPLVAVAVFATDSAGEEYSGVSDTEGSFLLGPMAVGSALIRVTWAPDREETAEVTVLANQEVEVTTSASCLDETCSEDSFHAGDVLPPRILLVIDKSLSMNDAAPGYPGSKWQATRDVLNTVVTGLEDSADFGLILFPHGASQDDPCRAGALDVVVAPGGASEIVERLDVTTPAGGTPTAATLRAAFLALSGMPSDGGRRVVVLATDGGPNCNPDLDLSVCTCVGTGDACNYVLNCLDDENTVSAAASLAAEGYAVFVIGVPGSEAFGEVLNELAVAGGTALADDTKFYEANSAEALASSLEAIATRAAGCRYDLPLPQVDPTSVTVTVDTSAVSHDPLRTDGWDLVDGNTVELFGPLCDQAVLEDLQVTVSYCGPSS